MSNQNDSISRQALKQAMYHEAFEVDSDMQKWDSGCWIRYKLFEKIVDSMPYVQPSKTDNTWIKCSEKMPENGKHVLVVIKEGGYTDICIGETYGEGNWLINGEFWYEKSDSAITHWRILPQLPKEEK